MTRANNSMSYLEFIAMVKYLWERIHPDIPIRPVQSGAFAKYPVIVYGLELRKPHLVEPKERQREEKKDDQGNIYTVKAQRFNNIVSFSAISKTDPELVEHLIEEFESFMLEYTSVFKKNGVSDLFYSRRVSDSEATRVAEDLNVRSIHYDVILEKVRFTQEEKLESILVDVRLFLNGQRNPGFEVTNDQIGTPDITLLQNNTVINTGDKVMLSMIDNDLYTFPGGAISGYVYTVSTITLDDSATPVVVSVGLQDHSGQPLSFTTAGKGLIFHTVLDNIEVSQSRDF
jgi:hypothetical protein